MRALRVLFGAAALLLALWSLSIPAIVIFGNRDEARPSDAIVVLGAAQYDGRPSPVLRARLDHALELYHSGIAHTLVLTGGVGVGDTVSEAEVGMRYANNAGVPIDRIITERSGLSSDESMRAVATILEENDLESAILVSDPFHMLRLRILAARHGIDARSSPTRSSPITRRSSEEWRHTLREALILPSAVVGITLPDA